MKVAPWAGDTGLIDLLEELGQLARDCGEEADLNARFSIEGIYETQFGDRIEFTDKITGQFWSIYKMENSK